jgi:hypothetical protein
MGRTTLRSNAGMDQDRGSIAWKNEEDKMTRRLIIKDYGKDYGFGRYQVTSEGETFLEDNLKIGTNDVRDAIEAVEVFVRHGKEVSCIPV